MLRSRLDTGDEMDKTSTPQTQPELKVAGFAIGPWCRAAGYSRATFYNLPVELRPHSVKVGKRHIIRETPEAYLARLAERAA